jgi:GTP cyclohydrolase II
MEHIAVERALAEIRSGRPVMISCEGEQALSLAVDGMTDRSLKAFRELSAPMIPYLVISARRARALGLETPGPIGLVLGGRENAADIIGLASDVALDRQLTTVAASRAAKAGIELAKMAERLPALLLTEGAVAVGRSNMGEASLIRVAAEDINAVGRSAATSLVRVAEANVPLNGGLQSRFVTFRDAIGGSSVAVIVGRPDLSRPVPVRLHSACLTGDVFGSRRCDCGDQLRLALIRLDEEGGGIIIYLEQEGRGLGLANKMRAYALQDAGLDTIDANATLGFDDDERDYAVAARMLQVLGCKQVRLLTNNPAKLDGLAETGIEVVGRIPLHGPVNADNRRYLTAKATRAGHKLDDLLGALADSADAPPVGPRTSR